jgi:ABC-2 type transport system ATP-binding protein
VGVAQALLCDPRLLLIDEPTSGLDPGGQREVIDLLAAVRDRGHTVFLCTHYLHEIEHLCDRVGVLSGGRIVVEARVRDLRAPGGSVLIEVDDIGVELRGSLEAISRGVSCDTRTVRIRQNTPHIQAAVLRRLLDSGAAIIALEPLESPLEQLYVQAVRGGVAYAQPSSLSIGQVEQPAPLATAVPTVPASVAQLPAGRRPGEGDTLLNELLRRGGDQGDEQGTGDREPGTGDRGRGIGDGE